MIDEFVGRHRELHALEKEVEARRGSFVPIYGRRRVGKSELIVRFMQGRPGVYFQGKRALGSLQRQEFLQSAADALGQPLLATQHVESWKAAIQTVLSQWKGPEKLILAFDEFQWTAAASPELPSILQELWDREWSRSGRVMLLLCGSYIGFMEREVLGRNSPLFGRRTAQIFLQPFHHGEAAQFQPAYSPADRARAYFICGGIPLYLNWFDDDLSLEQNIVRNLLDEFAPMHREPDFLLREELRDVDRYYSILLAIAGGRTTNRGIAAFTGLEPRGLHYYLQQLIELRYIARRHPLTGKPPSPRKVRYVLDDPLLRFWFRFVFPNLSTIRHLGARRALADRVRPDLDAYFGHCFEILCREALPFLYRQQGITAAFEVGEYWDRDTQIDVVGLRDDGRTDLGECKWGLVRSRPRLLDEIERKVQRYPNERNATVGRMLFTRDALGDDDTDGVHRYSLEDLYAVADDEVR